MHIITPYNPWAPKKKKTWQEEIWEQQDAAELEARLLAEAQRQQNSNQTETVNQTQAQTVGNAAVVASSGVGVGAGAAGAGGSPEYQYFNPSVDSGSLVISAVQTGFAPFTAILTATATGYGHQYATYTWDLGDGTSLVGQSVTHVFDTGSFSVAVTASSAAGILDWTGSTTNISASIPTVVSHFTATPLTGSAPLTVQFTNTSVNASVYLWTFSGSTIPATPISTSTDTGPAFTFHTPGTYTVRLGATGSYALTNATSSTNIISASIA